MYKNLVLGLAHVRPGRWPEVLRPQISVREHEQARNATCSAGCLRKAVAEQYSLQDSHTTATMAA